MFGPPDDNLSSSEESLKNSFNERNASIADFGALDSNFIKNDPMVKEREQKHQEKQAFDQWKQEHMIKPTGAIKDMSNPFAMIAN